MSHALPGGKVLFLDCETGGLSSANNPLLSIGLLVADESSIIATLEVKINPPANTWLEMPILADQLKGKYNKKIEYWLNLTSGEKAAPTEEKPASFITAVAAEVNGFVGASETIPGWDLMNVTTWAPEKFDYPAAAEQVATFLERFKDVDVVIGHNVEFDRSFVTDWLPEVMSLFPKTWACTQTHYKQKFLGGKTKGSSLAGLCKLAGYNAAPGSLHSALNDCTATYHVWRYLRGLP